MAILNFKQYQAIAKLRQLIPTAVRMIQGALSLQTPQLQVAHTYHEIRAPNDPVREEWNLLFADPHSSNQSFQEWTKRSPPAIFNFGTEGDEILTRHEDGGRNRVYFSTNFKVVKIADDRNEAIIVGLAIEGERIPNIAVLDVVQLATFASAMRIEDLYAIKQELVDTNISMELQRASVAILSFLGVAGKGALARLRSDPKKAVDKAAMFTAHETEAAVRPYIRLILDVVFLLLDKTGYLWTDIAPGNIGQDEAGKPVLFDLGMIYAHGKPRLPRIPSV